MNATARRILTAALASILLSLVLVAAAVNFYMLFEGLIAAGVCAAATHTEEVIPMIAGVNVDDWTASPKWMSDEKGRWRAYAAETTGGAVFVQESLWVLEWKNPHPAKSIRGIDFVASKRGVPILLGITLGQKK